MFLWLEIFAIFVLPVLLLRFRIVPLRYRLWVLYAVSALGIAVLIAEQWTLRDIGIRADNLREAFWPYAGFTVLGLAVVLILARILRYEPVKHWWRIPHFAYLFIPISIFQELLYRGMLMPQLAIRFEDAIWLIAVNASLFAFLHILFPDPRIMLPFAFIAGLGFAGMYYFYPNLILISLAHMVLNFVAVLYGFFSFRGNEPTA